MRLTFSEKEVVFLNPKRVFHPGPMVSEYQYTTPLRHTGTTLHPLCLATAMRHCLSVMPLEGKHRLLLVLFVLLQKLMHDLLHYTLSMILPKTGGQRREESCPTTGAGRWKDLWNM